MNLLLSQQVVSSLRDQLRFVSPSDPRLAVRTLCVCSVTCNAAGLGRAASLPLTMIDRLQLRSLVPSIPAPHSLCPQVPDRKQKGRVLGGSENPEYRMLEAVKQAMQVGGWVIGEHW